MSWSLLQVNVLIWTWEVKDSWTSGTRCLWISTHRKTQRTGNCSVSWIESVERFSIARCSSLRSLGLRGREPRGEPRSLGLTSKRPANLTQGHGQNCSWSVPWRVASQGMLHREADGTCCYQLNLKVTCLHDESFDQTILTSVSTWR